MRILSITILCLSCAITKNSVKDRLLETKVRNFFEQRKEKYLLCDSKNKYTNLLLKLEFNSKGQIKYLSVNNGDASKTITDCLYKELELVYFQEIKKNYSISFSLK